jgi:hypothetical protein
MNQGLIEFAAGVLAGGLGLSACWGLFWLIIGTAGLIRGTCGWRVVLNSLTVGLVPLLLIGGILWWSGGIRGVGSAFGLGVLGMPVVLVGLGLRQTPDGQRAGMHMLDGVRHLMDDLLGAHHECGGCGHDHDHGGRA